MIDVNRLEKMLAPLGLELHRSAASNVRLFSFDTDLDDVVITACIKGTAVTVSTALALPYAVDSADFTEAVATDLIDDLALKRAEAEKVLLETVDGRN